MKVGIVPEHFSLPWHLGKKENIFQKHNVEVDLEIYPRGTGSMCRSLRNGELDVAVALTEGIISDICVNGPEIQIIANYIDSPLHWAINVAPDSPYNSIDDLKGKTFGISRYGSGSHLMAFVLADQRKWNTAKEIQFETKGGIDDLIGGLHDKSTAAFMWETFTSKPYEEKGLLKRIGEIVTPWPCFVIAVRKEFLESNRESLSRFLDAIHESIREFVGSGHTLETISKECHLSMEDSAKWMSTVKFSDTGKVKRSVLKDTLDTLLKTGALDNGVEVEKFYDSGLTLLAD